MNIYHNKNVIPAAVLHWNYRGFTEFPLEQLRGEELDITDIYLKENLITVVPSDICRLHNLESLYLCGNDITELPREISKLQTLKCLDISGNRLRKIPEEIGEVRNLKFLILDENELTELPLRLAELRALRYLSVCDNKLLWLPQRPVFNYHHCEFRFWRNKDLKTIPYSLWYHMFRDQQTRSLNIGCLQMENIQHRARKRCRLKLTKDSGHYNLDVPCPKQYYNICTENSSPSLYELCRRKLYGIIAKTAEGLTEKQLFSSYNYYEDNIDDIDNEFENCNIENVDINGNTNGFTMKRIPSFSKRGVKEKVRDKQHYVPSDVVEEHCNFLPNFIKEDLIVGPLSRCEYVPCKRPVFDYAFYEFCFGRIILIDNTEQVILSLVFCSKNCAESWKKGNNTIIPWTLEDNL